MRRLSCVVLVLAAGCKPAFLDVKKEARGGPVTVASCGASATSTAGVIRAMDGPPSEIEGRAEKPAPEVNVCVRVTNGGRAPVKVDRSHLKLKLRRDRVPWVADDKDEILVVAPGETRKLEVRFQPGTIAAGEEIALSFDGAVRHGDASTDVPPLTFLKR